MGKSRSNHIHRNMVCRHIRIKQLVCFLVFSFLVYEKIRQTMTGTLRVL